MSCSSCRGTWLPPWPRLPCESERCVREAGPEVTPSWEPRYSCTSLTLSEPAALWPPTAENSEVSPLTLSSLLSLAASENKGEVEGRGAERLTED